ncbi:uncharacterized protein [Atheta coriaria]|uniref:uncharacterized protein n=1 Tax=Dalotia coriaria TaxID=877792 RepID=UPI0031F36FB8
MLNKFVFLACLMGIAVALPQQLPLGEKSARALKVTADTFDSLSPREKIESVNEMADVIITEVRLLMGDLGLDPYKLPDVHENFTFKPIIITYHGELDMERGWAQDVSEIYRNGNVYMDYTGRILTINVPIKFNKILFNYDYNAKLMDLGPDGSIEGSATDIQIYFSLALDFNQLVITLNEFDIVKIGKISCKFTGNGIIDWFVNLLTPIVTGIFKGLITLIAEVIVRSTLETVIDLLNDALQNIQPPTSEIAQVQDNAIKHF